MKILLQYTLSVPEGWIDVDHTQWESLPKRLPPPGAINNKRGWCHGLNIQGVTFSADHYHIQSIPGGVKITVWYDDPAYNPIGFRYARVWRFVPIAADPKLGGALNTRQSQVIFAEAGIMPTVSASAPLENTIFRDWSLFIPPSSNVMHGKEVSAELHAAHQQKQTIHGWREWTEGLPANELDKKGKIRTQREQGRYVRATGTRTYFARDTDRTTEIHVATHEDAFETTTASVIEETVTLSQETEQIGWVFTTPSGEPGSTQWPNGEYRCQLDVNTNAGSNELGLLLLGSANGHFARVNSGLTSDQQSILQDEAAFTGTGLKLATNTFAWSLGDSTNRFECLVAVRNPATHGGDRDTILDLNTSDSFADGPWSASTGIPIFMHSYRVRRVS